MPERRAPSIDIELRRRDAARVVAGDTTPEAYAAWMAEEEPFVADQRTWERADLIIHGSR